MPVKNFIYYKEIKLPELPLNLEVKDHWFSNSVRQERENLKTHRVAFSYQGVLYKNAYYKAYKIAEQNTLNELIAWFENIPFIKDFNKNNLNEVKDSNYLINCQTIWGHNWLTPHTDIGRKAQLIYILESGGENVTTTWYQEKGRDITRHRSIDKYLGNITDDKNLIELTSVKLKSKTWYYFRTDVIHGVRGINRERTSLCITLKSEKLHQKFLDEYIAELV